MKKKIFSIIALALAFGMSAQTFSIEHEVMDETTEGTPGNNPTDEAVTMYNYVFNESDAPIENLKWKLEEVDLPFGWSVYTFCDNQTCYTQSQVNQFIANGSEVPFFTIAVGESSELKPQIYVPEYADDGVGTVTVKVFFYTDDTETEIAEEQTATFIVRKGNVGVEVIDIKDERVALYPNPGNEQLFVYTDKSLSATNYQVFDLMGRKVMTGAIQGETTTINASALQTGHYLVKLIDNDNNSITTRKWIKK